MLRGRLMKMENLNVSGSPHIFEKTSKKRIMLFMLLALLPAAGYGVFLFGVKALLVMIVSIVSAVLTQILMQVLVKRKVKVDGSAVITGLLLGMILPPTVPLWMPVVGAFFGMAIVKWAFGGFGYAMFNPALAGRAFLMAAWPALMTLWVGIDGVTGATPLGTLKVNGIKTAGYFELFMGNVSGSVGETSALLLLIGGLFLMVTKVIDWRVPLAYIGSLYLLMFVLGKDPVFHVLAGGVVLGAFFMATGYEGMPLTKKGRVIFGVGCGLLTVIIRLYSGMPEGVTYAILLMNGFSPLIERWTRLKPLGFVKVNKNG